MGKAIGKLTGFAPSSPLNPYADPAGLFAPIFDERPKGLVDDSAGIREAPIDPSRIPNPWNRPKREPSSSAERLADRRRTITNAMRRRQGLESILTGAPPAGDPLGV